MFKEFKYSFSDLLSTIHGLLAGYTSFRTPHTGKPFRAKNPAS